MPLTAYAVFKEVYNDTSPYEVCKEVYKDTLGGV